MLDFNKFNPPPKFLTGNGDVGVLGGEWVGVMKEIALYPSLQKTRQGYMAWGEK